MQSTLHITPKFGPRPKSEGSHIIQGNLKFCQVPELLQRQDGIDNRDHGLAGIFNGILGVALGGRVVGVLLREVHTGRRGEGAGAAGVYGTGMVRFNTIQHYSVFQTGQNQAPLTLMYTRVVPQSHSFEQLTTKRAND